MIKFASIPIKYAPKRKMVGFVAPKWTNKMGEFDHPDVLSWVNNIYQSKVFTIQKEFNEAYDQAISKGLQSNSHAEHDNAEREQERDMIDEYGVPQEPKYEREQDDVQNEDEDRIGDGREGPVCRLKYYYK